MSSEELTDVSRDSVAMEKEEKEKEARQQLFSKYEEGPLSKGNTKCTDTFFLVLFIVYWLGMFGVFYVAFKFGDAERLLYATDYNGDTCGQANLADKKLGFYPRLAEDALSALQKASNCVQV